LLKFSPQLAGAQQKWDVLGSLEVSGAEDARLAAGGGLVVSGGVLLEAYGVDPRAGQLPQRH
jgi:hypothetical protein